MTDTPRTQLERAYRLIQQERGSEALDVLRPVLAKDRNNADAWWLMANAVDEPEDAREALENVLRITPNHVEARNLLDQLNATSMSGGFEDDDLNDFFASPVARAADVVPVADTLDRSADSPFDTDNMPSFVGMGEASTRKPRDFTDVSGDDLPEFGDFGANQSPVSSGSAVKAARPMARRRTNPVLVLLLALLVIVIIGGLFVILNQNKGAVVPTVGGTATVDVAANGTAQSTLLALVPTSATQSATSAALNSTPINLPTSVAATSSAGINSASSVTQAAMSTTSAATLDTVPVSTVSTVSTVPSVSSDAALSAAIQSAGDQFHVAGMPDAQVNVSTSSFGKTLTVRFCSKTGPTLAKTVDTAMDTLATQAAPASSALQAISVEVTGCANTSQILYKAVASIQDVNAYIGKTLSVHEFRAAWKPS